MPWLFFPSFFLPLAQAQCQRNDQPLYLNVMIQLMHKASLPQHTGHHTVNFSIWFVKKLPLGSIIGGNHCKSFQQLFGASWLLWRRLASFSWPQKKQSQIWFCTLCIGSSSEKLCDWDVMWWNFPSKLVISPMLMETNITNCFSYTYLMISLLASTFTILLVCPFLSRPLDPSCRCWKQRVASSIKIKLIFYLFKIYNLKNNLIYYCKILIH